MITRITSNIYTGAFKDISECHEYGLSSKNVADVRHIVDKAGNDISYIIECIDIAKNILNHHGQVLITCDMGVSRSRVVAIGLLAELGNSIDEATTVVLRSANNPEINPDLILLLRNYYKSKEQLTGISDSSVDDGAVVLGANGFVGSALIKYLKKKQIDSIGLTRCDINIKEELIKLITILESVKQSNVILCAHPQSHHTAKSQSDSILLLKNTLEACRLTGKNLIYISSMVVYLGHAHAFDDYIYRADESTPAFPYGSYSESKYLCEQLIEVYRRNYGLGVTIVRPCGLYGSEMRPEWLIPKLIHKALNNEEIVTHKYKNGLPLFELLYIDDFADAIGRLLGETSMPHVVNIGSHELTSTRELADLIAHKAQSSSHRKLLHVSDCTRNILTVPGYIDSLGWKPTISLCEGLKVCIFSSSMEAI